MILQKAYWYSFGICDEGNSKGNFAYWMQKGVLGYSEGE